MGHSRVGGWPRWDIRFFFPLDITKNLKVFPNFVGSSLCQFTKMAEWLLAEWKIAKMALLNLFVKFKNCFDQKTSFEAL
jgi:hypothetical protein